MRNRTGISLGAALLLALMVSPAVNGGADARPWRGGATPLSRPQTFNVSGEFSGVLGSVIQLGGVVYRVAPTAVVYEIGKGPVPLGTVVADRYVFMSGVGSEGSGTVFTVIVRPAEKDVAQGAGDRSRHVHTKDSAQPE